MYDYLTKISSVLTEDINIKDFADSLSRTQFLSKKWLVDELIQFNKVSNPTILILGGWYGSYLVPMLNDKLAPTKIYFNDADQQCIKIAQLLHRSPNISFHCFDATKENKRLNPNIVINTSCEHMGDYTKMMEENPRCLFVLQTCDNKNDPGHVNTSSTTQEFVQKLNLQTVYFAARRNIGHKNRFMVIGQN
jgi:hypothetical protein